MAFNFNQSTTAGGAPGTFLMSGTSTAASTAPPAFGAPTGPVFSFGNLGAAATTTTPATATPTLNLGGGSTFGSLAGDTAGFRSFAAPTSTPATVPSTGGSLFGSSAIGGTGNFSFASPAVGSTTLGAPPSFGSSPGLGMKPSGGFGTPTSTTGLSMLANTATGTPKGVQFGSPATPALNFSGGSATTNAATGFSLPGATSTGFSLGTSPAMPGFTNLGTPASTAAASPKPAATGFSLTPGAPAATGFSMPPPATTGATATASVAPTFGSGSSFLSKPGTTAAPSLGSTAPTLSASLGFGVPSTASIAPSATSTVTSSGISSSLGQPLGLVTSTASTTVTSSGGGEDQSSQKSMSYAQLEEFMNKWSVELEGQEKVFITQATQVNAWDRVLLESGDKITALNSTMESLKMEQQKLDLELDYITSQERELEESIGPLEKAVAAMTGTDPERQQTYELAENLEGQTKQMAEDLKEIIDHLNELNRAQDENNPVVQIGRILNAHMNSLQWIDQTASSTQTQLEEVAKMVEMQKRDLERPYSLSGY